MGRPEGYLWSYPGIGSLTIAYHDTSDFYYSGHVGSCTMFMMENYALGEKKLFYITMFILINEALFLIFTRSHYIIDLFSGFCLVFLVHRAAECIAYIYDVRIIGARAKERDSYYYKPCMYCGWVNSDASHKISSEELAHQEKILEFRRLRESIPFSIKTG